MKGKMSNIVSSTLQYFGGFCMFVMLALTFADVIGRYFLNRPIPGAAEIISLALGIGAFAALPLVTRDREHIKIDIIDKFLKGRVHYIQRLMMLIGTLCWVGFMSWLLFKQAQTFRKYNFLTEYLDLPKAHFVFILALFSAFSVFLFAFVIWRYLMQGGDPRDEDKK